MWNSCRACLLFKGCKVYEVCLMMLTWQATSSGWFLGTGRTNMSSVELWYHRVWELPRSP
eukprot:CCRYP_004267-RA/>CCRYP_004267-RA protein AED:0.00 eAED:0.00 QI:19/1/1/1/0/0/2/47/59